MNTDGSRLDETIEGGAYIKGNKVVDSFGEERKGWTVVEGVATPPTDPKDAKRDQDEVKARIAQNNKN